MNQQDWKYKLFTIFYEVSNRTDYDSSTSVLSDTNNVVIYNNDTGYDSFVYFSNYYCNTKVIEPLVRTYDSILFAHPLSSTTSCASSCVITDYDSVAHIYSIYTETKPVKLKNNVTDYDSVVTKPLSIYFNAYSGIQWDIDYNIYSKLLVNQYTNPCHITYQPTSYDIYAVTLVNQNTNAISHKMLKNGYNVKFSRDAYVNFAAMAHPLVNSNHDVSSTMNVSNDIKSKVIDNVVSNHSPVINFGMSTYLHADTGIWWYRSIDSVTGNIYYPNVTLNLLKNIVAGYDSIYDNITNDVNCNIIPNIQGKIDSAIVSYNSTTLVKPKIIQSKFNDYLNILNKYTAGISQIKSAEALNNIITAILFDNTTVKIKKAKHTTIGNANTAITITKVATRKVNTFKNLKTTDFCNFKLHNSNGTRVDNDDFANVVVKY